jgi:hypothetical protein
VFNEINKRFPTFPFACRDLLLDESSARLGLRECVNHELLIPYPVLYENKGDLVVHFKCTVLVLPSRTSKIAGLGLGAGSGFEAIRFVSGEDRGLSDDLKEILALEDGSKTKMTKKEKALLKKQQLEASSGSVGEAMA